MQYLYLGNFCMNVITDTGQSYIVTHDYPSMALSSSYLVKCVGALLKAFNLREFTLKSFVNKKFICSFKVCKTTPETHFLVYFRTKIY